MIAVLLRSLSHHGSYLDFGTKRNKAPSLSMFISASISHNTIKPRRELRVLLKLVDTGEQLEKDLLCHIVRHRSIAAVVKRDRVNSIFVRLKQVVESFPVPLFASFDDLSV